MNRNPGRICALAALFIPFAAAEASSGAVPGAKVAPSGSYADLKALLTNTPYGSGFFMVQGGQPGYRGAIDGDTIVIPPGSWNWGDWSQGDLKLPVSAAVTFVAQAAYDANPAEGGTFLVGGPSFDVAAAGANRVVTFDHLDLDASAFIPVEATAIKVESGASAKINATTIAGHSYIYAVDVTASTSVLATTSIINSTISGTSFGIHTNGTFPTTNIILVSNSTVTGNETGIFDDTPIGGDGANPFMMIQFSNSIVAGNMQDFEFTNYESAYIFMGQNIVSSNPQAQFLSLVSPPGYPAMADGAILAPADVGPLTMNGGLTRTHRPLAGSAAIGAILESQTSSALYYQAATPVVADQRDVTRGVVTWIGAVDEGADEMALLTQIDTAVNNASNAVGGLSTVSTNTSSILAELGNAASPAAGTVFGALSALSTALSSLQGAVAGIAGAVNTHIDAAVAPLATSGQVATVAAGVSAANAQLAGIDATLNAVSESVNASMVTLSTPVSGSVEAPLALVHQVEDDLANAATKTSFLVLPSKFGGHLELVSAVVHGEFADLQAAGFTLTATAQTSLQNADAAYAAGQWASAFTWYERAYRQAKPF